MTDSTAGSCVGLWFGLAVCSLVPEDCESALGQEDRWVSDFAFADVVRCDDGGHCGAVGLDKIPDCSDPCAACFWYDSDFFN